MHRESVSIVQQDATIYRFIIFSADNSKCFGWYPHPSSGAHSNCNYNIWHLSNCFRYHPLTWSRNGFPTPPRQRTVRPVPDVVITVWMCSWWWMMVSSETSRAVWRKYNKTVYNRILLDNYWLQAKILNLFQIPVTCRCVIFRLKYFKCHSISNRKTWN